MQIRAVQKENCPKVIQLKGQVQPEAHKQSCQITGYWKPYENESGPVKVTGSFLRQRLETSEISRAPLLAKCDTNSCRSMTEIHFLHHMTKEGKSGRKNREEDARRIAWKLLLRSSSLSRDTTVMSTMHISSKDATPTEDAPASTSRQVLKSKKNRMYVVDSGASLHMTGISSLTPKVKRTIRKTSKHLEIETGLAWYILRPKRKSTSRSLVPLSTLNWWRTLLQCDLWDHHATNWLVHNSWRPAENPKLTKGKNTIECCINNFVPLVARNRPSHAKHHQAIQY